MGKRNRAGLVIAAAAGAAIYASSAKAELTQLALRFDTAPGPGAGSYISFVIPAINSNGVGAFNSTITGSPTGSNEGIFRSDGTVVSMFRTLQTAPGTGGGQFSDFNNNPAINASGQVAINSSLTGTSDASTNGVFRTGDGINFTAIARDKLSAPGGGAYLALGAPQINSGGQVMFFSTLAGTADGSTSGIFRSDGVTPTLLARDKQSAPGPGGGTFNTLTLSTPAFNDLGQTAFSASVVGGTNTQGVFRSDGTAIAIARGVQPAPGGGTWNNFNQPDMNSRGDVVFTSSISGAADGAVAGIFRSDGITPAAIVRTNQPAPGGGTFTNLSISPTVNSAGQVVFWAVFNNSPDGATDGIFRGDGGAVEVIARANQPAPGGGGGVYSSFNSSPTMNNAGAVAFFASLTGTSGGTIDDSAIYLADPQETLVVAREGQSAFGSTISFATFAGGQNKQSRGPLNDAGQIALSLTLNNGNQLVVRFTPEIHFRNAGGGNWDTNTNWTVGIKPAAPHDVFVDPPSQFGATVSGPSTNVSMKSLTIAGRNGGSAQLNLNGGGNVTVTNAITIAANGSVTVQTGSLNGQSITVGGSLTESVGASINATTLVNNNFTSLSGNATVAGAVENNASMSLNNGAVLTAPGGITNFSGLSIDNATIAGNLTNSFGASMNGRGSISGTINNQGTLTMTGLLIAGGTLTNSGVVNVGLSDNFRMAGAQNGGMIALSGGALTPNGSVQLDNNSGGVIQGAGAISINLRNVAGLINANGTQPLVISTLLGNLAGAQIRVADGSALNVNSTFTNNGLINLAGGSAAINGLSITNPGNIRGAGIIGNPVANSGTLRAEGGLLSVMGTSNSNSATGQILVADDATLLYSQGLATNAGTISLTGGSFDNNNLPMNNTGRITGWGSYSGGTLTNNNLITFTGGFTTINANVTNAATRQFRVAYNPALFTGNVTNNGIFKNTATTITFAGTYTENGTFISDPADNFFSSVMIGEVGAWVGGVGDRFFVSGDLISRSGNKSGWQTSDAQLSLIGGFEHLLSVPGVDRGRSFEGYVDNFAWGSLVLGAGDHLKLEDANGEAGGALYVHSLLLGGGLGQISNIASDGLSIYYDLRDPANAYLGGETYALAGGGQIVPVPEPMSAGFLGLAALTLLNRKRKQGR